VPVFEVPTMPTSVPGLRLKNALERAVADAGWSGGVHGRVVAVEHSRDGFGLSVAATPSPARLRARAVILATGRFMGRGLEASRTRVREPLLDLYVTQPAARSDWHQADLFDARGHALNRAGLEVDDGFRVVRRARRRRHPRLFTVASILAHQTTGAYEVRGRMPSARPPRGHAPHRRAGPRGWLLVTPFGWARRLAVAIARGRESVARGALARLGLPPFPSSARERAIALLAAAVRAPRGKRVCAHSRS